MRRVASLVGSHCTFGILMLGVASQCFVPTWSRAQTVPIPQLAAWESHMINYGNQHCNALQGGPVNERIDKTYYDAERVYYQIQTYTNDPSWKYCAGLAERAYRDQYVLRNDGKVPGYWNFTTGLRMDFQRYADGKSKQAISLLSQNAAFAPDGTPLEWTAGTDASREVAYTIICYLDAEAVGLPRRARLTDMVNQALGHIDQWFVSQTAPYMRPFMVGLTLQALIRVQAVMPDPRIPQAIATAIDGLWTRTWLPAAEAFMYTDRVASDQSGGMEPASDLNLLIAPAYAWMYLQSGNTLYRDRGDQIFAGGVKGAYLGIAKLFNQNYMWSFDYVTWRRAAG
jgi:hypothetical protein